MINAMMHAMPHARMRSLQSIAFLHEQNICSHHLFHSVQLLNDKYYGNFSQLDVFTFSVKI